MRSLGRPHTYFLPKNFDNGPRRLRSQLSPTFLTRVFFIQDTLWTSSLQNIVMLSDVEMMLVINITLFCKEDNHKKDMYLPRSPWDSELLTPAIPLNPAQPLKLYTMAAMCTVTPVVLQCSAAPAVRSSFLGSAQNKAFCGQTLRLAVPSTISKRATFRVSWNFSSCGWRRWNKMTAEQFKAVQ